MNPQSGELRRHGVRIRLAGQPFRILLALLEQPGELVSREQLRAKIWADNTFVDFEGGLNAAVNRLRRALDDSAEHPRYIETVPARGYRFLGHLENSEPPGVVAVPAAVAPKAPELSRIRRWGWIVSAVAVAAVSFLLGWWMHRTPQTIPSAPWDQTRLTSDAGLSFYPALSPDGKLLAWSSGSSLNGDRDLYVRQIAGGRTIRLTADGAGNNHPAFSPDGTQIAFSSTRNGGGIFLVPALGGDPRRLASAGVNPKFSPDGSTVAYWTGPWSVNPSVPGSGAVWLVPAAGGVPRRVGSNLTAARWPIWMPDGKHLLVLGYSSSEAYQSQALDLWMATVDGGQAVATGVNAVLARNGITFVPGPGCWSKDALVVSIARGGVRNLWEIGFDRNTGKTTGSLHRLTNGAGLQMVPACSGESIAYSQMDTHQDLWWLSVDLNRAVVKGLPRQITDTPALREHVSLSDDGGMAAFSSDQSGQWNIWVRDLQTGSETLLSSSPLVQRYPLLSPSGARVAFSVFEKGGRALYVSAPQGEREKVCDGCLRATDWSADEKSVLTFGGDPYHVDLIDLASRRTAALLKHSSYQLLYGKRSPDCRWVSFTERVDTSRGRIFIAPLDAPKPIPESVWIPVAEVGPADWAEWSPDSKTLYFTSRRDGHYCLWAQRIDPRSGQITGGSFAVQHLHGPLSYDEAGWSAAGGRIAMVLNEDTGNIWMISPAPGPR